MSDLEERHKKRAYKRMLLGALIGAFLLTFPCALLLWKQGAFQKVPMFTLPPGMMLMLLGTIGAVVGALEGEGVGPSQLVVMTEKASRKGAKIRGISAFLMAKQGR